VDGFSTQKRIHWIPGLSIAARKSAIMILFFYETLSKTLIFYRLLTI